MNVSERTVRKIMCDTCMNTRKVYRLRWNKTVAEIRQKLTRKGLSTEDRKRLVAKRAT